MVQVPSSESEWQTRARVNKIPEGRTIHERELKESASKISEKQYLLLRVLWQIPARGKSQTIPNRFGLADWVQKATPILRRYESWRKYCESFHQAKIPEGTFALPRFYQRQAANVPSTIELPGDSDVVFTPVAGRTRGKVNLISRIREMVLETPSKAPKCSMKITGCSSPEELSLGLDEEEESEESEESESIETPLEQRTPGPQEILGLIHPKTKDEQIVNTALIDFLNAFIIHENMPVQWTLYRKPFKAHFRSTSFEARTDGCLEDMGPKGKVYAIVEVKPVIRIDETVMAPSAAILMQEAAQMVAWIKNDPDPIDLKHSCGRRLHVSQDRHEIYIIFAEYDENYVKYVNDKLQPGEEPGFLKMHQYGPWDTEELSDMKNIGQILLGISLRARGMAEGKS